MLQLITTKMLPATNFQPHRIKATCSSGVNTVTVDNNHLYSHRYAAKMLCQRLGWPHRFVSGQDHRGDYHHILLHAAVPTGAYRSKEVHRIFESMQKAGEVHIKGGPEPDPALLQLGHFGHNHSAQTRCINLELEDVAALLALFNQVDPISEATTERGNRYVEEERT